MCKHRDNGAIKPREVVPQPAGALSRGTSPLLRRSPPPLSAPPLAPWPPAARPAHTTRHRWRPGTPTDTRRNQVSAAAEHEGRGTSKASTRACIHAATVTVAHRALAPPCSSAPPDPFAAFTLADSPLSIHHPARILPRARPPRKEMHPDGDRPPTTFRVTLNIMHGLRCYRRLIGPPTPQSPSLSAGLGS